MSNGQGAETESERITRETQQKEDADAATRGSASNQTTPISEQSFIQYVRLVEEARKRDQEVQNKFMHDLLAQTGQRRENGRGGVSLAEF
jgi:hypothetical protein